MRVGFRVTTSQHNGLCPVMGRDRTLCAPGERPDGGGAPSRQTCHRRPSVEDRSRSSIFGPAPEPFTRLHAPGIIRLIDLAAGYGFTVKDGRVGAPRGVAWVDRPDGTRWLPPRPPERRVFSPETSWLVMDMMSDPEARRPGFGMELPFDLPFRVAAKT